MKAIKRLALIFGFAAMALPLWSASIFEENFSSGSLKGTLERAVVTDGKLMLETGNLIANGSFEGNGKMPTAGYYLYDTTKGAVDTQTAFDGKNSVRLDGPTSLYLHPENFVEVSPEIAEYMVSAWVKTEFRDSSSSIQLRVWGHNSGKTGKTQVVAANIQQSTDWTRLIQNIRIEKDTSFISFDIGYRSGKDAQSSSKVWIDAVQIEPGNRRPGDFTEKYSRHGIYTSPVITYDSGTLRIIFEGQVPDECRLETRFRNTREETNIEDSAWSEWRESAAPASIPQSGVLQFQLRMSTGGRGSQTPALLSIRTERTPK